MSIPPSVENESISAWSKVLTELSGLIRSMLELLMSNNAILTGRSYTGRLNDAANERQAQRTDIQMAFADRSHLATEIGKLTRRMDKFEEVQREILYHVTPWWQRRQKWWKVTKGER